MLGIGIHFFHIKKILWMVVNSPVCLQKSACISNRDMHTKLQWGITSQLSEWPSSKNLQTINAGEGVEKRESSFTVGGNVNWYSHYIEQYDSSLKTNNKTTIWPSNPTTGHIPREEHNSKRHMHPNVHCSTIYNSHVMEAT